MFCDDDIVAGGLYLAARERGLKIPRDVSVIGFDDMDFARVLDPALTTVALDAELLGADRVRAARCSAWPAGGAAADRAPGRARRSRLDRAAAVSDSARAVFAALPRAGFVNAEVREPVADAVRRAPRGAAAPSAPATRSGPRPWQHEP